VLDAMSGIQEAMYVHVGHIMDIEVVDLDGDGTQEILLCGVNNSYRSAFLAVLDSRAVSGCSPARAEYRCAKPAPARHRAYVLIPRTIAGELFHNSVKNNSASAVNVEPLTGEIKVRVDDGVNFVIHRTGRATATLNYIFNSRVEIERIAPGDDYDLLVDDLYDRGLLQQKPDSKYLTELKGRLRYWTGERWREEAKPSSGAK
jgi:hypothetical protein